MGGNRGGGGRWGHCHAQFMKLLWRTSYVSRGEKFNANVTMIKSKCYFWRVGTLIMPSFEAVVADFMCPGVRGLTQRPPR